MSAGLAATNKLGVAYAEHTKRKRKLLIKRIFNSPNCALQLSLDTALQHVVQLDLQNE